MNEPTCECIVDGCKNRISALDDQFWCGEHGGETVYEITDRKGLVAAQKAKSGCGGLIADMKAR